MGDWWLGDVVGVFLQNCFANSTWNWLQFGTLRSEPFHVVLGKLIFLARYRAFKVSQGVTLGTWISFDGSFDGFPVKILISFRKVFRKSVIQGGADQSKKLYKYLSNKSMTMYISHAWSFWSLCLWATQHTTSQPFFLDICRSGSHP